MIELMDIVAAFVIGFFAALLGAVSTGANLISIPGLIFMGISPVSAIATTRLSAISGGLAAVYRYNKAKAVLWRYIPHFLLISLAAGILGPQLLMRINEQRIEPLIGGLLLAMLPLLFVKHTYGNRNKPKSLAHKMIGLVILLVVMVYSTAFGVGGGVFLLYTLVYFYGMDVTQANATGTVIWIVGAAVALITYIHEGDVLFWLAIPLVLGAAIGGTLGARLALKKGTIWVKYVLAIVMAISGIKLIF